MELILKEKKKIIQSYQLCKNLQFGAVAYIYMTKTSKVLIFCNVYQ